MDYHKIINKNVVKIIEVLREGRLYLNQISEKSSIKSKNNLLKNLNYLVDFKILRKEKNKSNTFYYLNYNNQLLLVLLQLINIIKLQNLPFERRKALIEIIHGIQPRVAILFGSTAKGNFKKESDIDLLLYLNTNEDIKKEIREISSRYGVKINPIILTKIDARNETIRHIFKTGYPITGYIYFYEIYHKEILGEY